MPSRAETTPPSLNSFDHAPLSCIRLDLAEHHSCLPILLVVMATLGRTHAFPFIDVVRAQQQALQLPSLVKVDMAGFEFYPQPPPWRPWVHDLVHLTKQGECALGAAMANAWLALESRGVQR